VASVLEASALLAVGLALGAATFILLAYQFAPNVTHRWVWLTPGTLLGTALWLLASVAFRMYVVNFGSVNSLTHPYFSRRRVTRF
jgi:uncharacterized BrkB/YihY/UPF0761 family membrane protein